MSKSKQTLHYHHKANSDQAKLDRFMFSNVCATTHPPATYTPEITSDPVVACEESINIQINMGISHSEDEAEALIQPTMWEDTVEVELPPQICEEAIEVMIPSAGEDVDGERLSWEDDLDEHILTEAKVQNWEEDKG